MSFLNKLTFHNAKKLVSSTTAPTDHPTEAADPAFEAAAADFKTYHDALFAIDRSMSEYAKHMYDLYNSSYSIIDAMARAISNDDAATLRNTFANTRQSHSILTSDREATISADLRANCLKPLQDELSLHAKLQASIQQRQELAKEVDYYSGKMESLLTDKAKTEAKGKPADMEKIERNQKKKDEAASMYTVVNAELITQLQATVLRKGELLTQVFNSFEHIERQVAETYMAAVGTGGTMVSSTTVTSTRVSTGSSASPTMSDFIARMGDVNKHRNSSVSDGSDDGGVAISLGMEGQPDSVSNARNTLTTTTKSSSSYRANTPPPPSYTPTAYMPAPVAAARTKQPGSPQPQPPPPPPPPPATHL